MRLLPLSAAAAALVVSVAACGSNDPNTASSTSPSIRVAATSTQVADMVRNVAGDRAEVSGILTPNSDPHEYEPRPSDAKAVARASLVFRSGGDVDDWLGDVIASSEAKAKVVDLMDAVTTRTADGHHEHGAEGDADEPGDDASHDEGEIDPHWWQDPRNGEAAARRIADALSTADPAGRSAYEANAARYIKRLEALDAAIAVCMNRIPEQQRKLVTNHDALGYFADRYGVQVVGAVIPALSTQAKASAGETQQLVRTIRRERVGTIFPESSVNPRVEKAIARETGAKVGPALWADTLGPKDSSGATYLSSLRFNAAAMADGFSNGKERCDLPQ